MALHYRRQGESLLIYGDTYRVKDQLKALGARFQGGTKTWIVPFSETAVAALGRLSGAGGDLGAGSEAPGPPAAAGDMGQAAARPDPAPPPLPAADGLTVRQLLDQAALAVTAAFPRAQWVVGEIQNIAPRAKAVYFDLAEGRADGHANATLAVRAVLWNSTLEVLRRRHGKDKLDAVLQDGMRIRCLCQVQLFRDRGQLSLSVEDLDPAYTRGALALAREQLLKELRAKGLDQANKRLTVPALPFRIGLISAEGSRAVSDFLDQLTVGGFPGTVFHCHATMQGESTPASVCRALTALAGLGVDLIVVTRGGGSAADLRWFDAPEIAYAIAASPVPVIAAIGHHDDVCVAEEICHQRQKTPTAAADDITGRFQAVRQRLGTAAAGMIRAMTVGIELAAGRGSALAGRLDAGTERAVFVRLEGLARAAVRLAAGADQRLQSADLQARTAAESLVSQAMERLNAAAFGLSESTGRLALAAERETARREAGLAAIETLLTRYDPAPRLAQGWTRLAGPGGPLRRAVDAAVGERIMARLLDGTLELRVEAITTDPGPTKTENRT